MLCTRHGGSRASPPPPPAVLPVVGGVPGPGDVGRWVPGGGAQHGGGAVLVHRDALRRQQVLWAVWGQEQCVWRGWSGQARVASAAVLHHQSRVSDHLLLAFKYLFKIQL